jgi:hypothetical protein
MPNGWASAVAPGERRRRRIVLTVVAVVMVLALVGGGFAVFGGSTSTSTSTSAPTATTAPTAQGTSSAGQLLQAALAAARRSGSFHYVSVSSSTGPQGGTQRTVGDAGPDGGRQVITDGNQRFTVVVTGTSCYIEGNAAALTANLGLSATTAAAHAGRWISLAPADPPYAAVYAAVTASSALADNITMTARQERPVTTAGRRRIRTVVGVITPVHVAGQTIAIKGTATLAVAVASHLPIRYAQRGTVDRQRTTSELTFSRWGERVTVTAPTGAVPYSSLPTGSGVGPTTGSTVLT